ncbi:MAG: hypothetical protein WBP22_05720 [Candidatus Saccharimonas sp.]
MTAPTLDQGQKLLSLFKGWSSEEVQVLIASGLLGAIRDIGAARLGGLRLDQFRALLESTPATIQWRSPSKYWEKFEEWNRRFDLGIPSEHVINIGKGLQHRDPYAPATVCYYSGCDLIAEWETVMSVLCYELSKIKMVLSDGVSPALLRSREGSATWTSSAAVHPTGFIDFKKYWHSGTQETLEDILSKEPCWGGLEIVWLLALNLSVFTEMNKGRFPSIFISGLELPGVGVPYIGCTNREVYVSYHPFSRPVGDILVANSWM